ncbi:MAG: hypothetical protein MUF10_07245 [Thermoanaerobaculaceae bacterium]|jgi:hypothetical protein|nr:hypothetical protein [Thermoanaerobaculaceae bacterium]
MRAGRLLAVVVVAVLSAAPVRGDYKQAYSEAIKALDTGRWADVARLMRQAAAEQPREGERIKIYGMRFEIYLPHFYLGQALAETNDCAGALAAFATSESQGVVKTTDRWGELQRLRNRCQVQQPAVEPAATRPAAPPTATRAAAPPTPDLGSEVRKAEVDLARATELERTVVALRRSAAAVWQERPALGARSDQAVAKLGAARAALEKGRAGSAAELVQASRLTGEATRELQAVRDEANGRWNELQAAEAQRQGQATEQARQEEARRQVLRQELAAVTQEATALEASVGAAGARPEVRQAQADLGRSRSRAAAATGASTADELQTRREEMQQSVARLRQALAAAQAVPSPNAPPAPTAIASRSPASAPEVLRQGAEAFLGADYRRAIELLATSQVSEPRASAVAALVRGAARHALFLEAGGREADILEAARADIRACRRLDATVAPDMAFFSPSFVALFEDTH